MKLGIQTAITPGLLLFIPRFLHSRNGHGQVLVVNSMLRLQRLRAEEHVSKHEQLRCTLQLLQIIMFRMRKFMCLWSLYPSHTNRSRSQGGRAARSLIPRVLLFLSYHSALENGLGLLRACSSLARCGVEYLQSFLITEFWLPPKSTSSTRREDSESVTCGTGA